MTNRSRGSSSCISSGDWGVEHAQPCASAQEALALLERPGESPDLIFCDLQMPEMDGVEFVRHLVRAGYAGGLVLVSGEDERLVQTAAKLARAHKLKVLGALNKPVPIDSLKQFLDGDVAHSPAQGRNERKTYSAERLRRAIADGELVNHYQPRSSSLRARSPGSRPWCAGGTRRTD